MSETSATGAKRGWLVLVFLAVYLLLSLFLFDPKPDIGGDNAVYLILGKALATGQGLTDIHLLDSPAQTQYPPLFPAILALLYLLGGGTSVLAAKVLVVLFGLGAMYFTWRVLRHLLHDRAWVVMPVVVTTPLLITANHAVLSEIPFLCLSMAAVLFLLRAGPSRRWAYWVGFVLSVASVMVRTAGIGLVLAVALYLLLRREYRLLALFALLFLAVMVPWQLRNARVGEAQPYLARLLARDPYELAKGRVDLFCLFTRFWDNLALYAFGVLPQATIPLLRPGVWSIVVGLLLSGLAVLGAATRVRRMSLLESYALFGAAVFLFWPRVWGGERFLLPLLPLIIMFIFSALAWVEERMKFRYLVLPVAVVLVALNCVHLSGRIPAALRRNRAYLAGDRLAGYPPDWRRFFEAAEWLRENVDADKVVMARKPEFVYLVAGLRTTIYPFTRDPVEVRAAIDRCDYVLFDNFKWTGATERYLEKPLYTERYRLLRSFETSPPKFYVVRVLKDEPDPR